MSLEDERQAEVIKVFERGARLYQITHAPGYQDLLDILEAEVVKYEFRTLNLQPGTDEQLLRDTVFHGRVARSLFEQLQIKVNDAIELGVQITQASVPQPNYTNF